jgi:hypothetical protein
MAIHLDKVDEAKVRAYLSSERLASEGDKTTVLKRLATYYRERREAGVEMALCDNCGCTGPASLSECPFCGDGSPVSDALVAGEADPKNELEALCRIVRDGMRVASQNLYNVGQALIKIIDEGLWKQRLGEDGEPVYSGPYACIAEECGMDRKAANKLVAVVRSYDAPAFKEHGVTRLQISLRLPEEKRTRFLERAQMENDKRGPEDRHLARTMLQESESSKVCENVAFQTVEPKPVVKAPPKVPKTAVVRLRLGTATIPLHRRETAHGKGSGPATSLRDAPWCDVHLGGDVFLGIRISRTPDGELVAVVETKTVLKTTGSGSVSLQA